jgi:UDP-glucose-4-epimerase GalE
MRILVTGGAGYVGSHCVRDLCTHGHDVTVLDNLAKGHRAAVHSRAQVIVGDVGDQALLGKVFAKGPFDAVMHFAALAEVGESVQWPLRYYQANVANSVALLDAMREHGVKRMVFSSSCAVYGIPPAVPITEDMPLAPISPYGRTKLVIEWALADSARAWGLGATALRYFNAAGAADDGSIGEDHEPESHLIPRVLQVALGRHQSISIFGRDYPTPDGTCIRDYVHVDDLAAAHRKAVEEQMEGQFRAYNLGTGTGASVHEVIAAARAATSHAIPATIGPRREGDPPALFADASKARQELCWSPRFTRIIDVIASAWEWHRRHPTGYGAG